MAERDFEKEFMTIVGEQLSLERMREIASRQDVQFWVGKKVLRLEFIGLRDTPSHERFEKLVEVEMREQLAAIFGSLNVAQDSTEVIIGLAEDIAKERMQQYGY